MKPRIIKEVSMIEFNAGTFTGDGKPEDLKTYRDGGISVPVRVNNIPEAHVLLDNVNKICRVKFEIEGKSAVFEGELVKLSTYRGGGIGLSFVLDKQPKTSGFLLVNVHKQGTITVEFSSTKGKSLPAEVDEGQPNLDNLEQDDPE
jgi:hypothetical protein